MKQITSLLAVLPVLLASCSNEPEVTGDAFVPREVFIDVLVDIHLVDGITQERMFYRRYKDVDSIDVLSPIFDKHGIDAASFDTTMYAYSRYPELYDQIYNEVLMKLNMMLDELDNSPEK